MKSATQVVKRYLPDGSVRAIWDDRTGDRERRQGLVPGRASRIEVVPEGPKAGLFHVDFSPLADLTGDDRYRACLAQTFASYTEANRAEVAWLLENYVMDGAGGE